MIKKKVSYPFGTKFGQFVHIGSMSKASSVLSSYLSEQLFSGTRQLFGLWAALSAFTPSLDRLVTFSDR